MSPVMAELLKMTTAAERKNRDLLRQLKYREEKLYTLQSLSTALEQELGHRLTFLRLAEAVRRTFPIDVVEVWCKSELPNHHECVLHS